MRFEKSVQLSSKMHDGIIRTLTGVRHILYIKKNLISLITLVMGGHTFIRDGDFVKVVKGALTVMKGLSRYYVLQASVVTSTINVSSSISDSDTTELWHMRLEHMSGRGLKILSKWGLLYGHNTSKLEFCEHCIFGK